MIASAQTIKELHFITPFHERTKDFGMTYGLGPAGYDVRIAEDLYLQPHSMKLASILEHRAIPRKLLGVVHDKSTWARMGLAVQNTIIEPGWRGFLTIELSNHSEKVINLTTGMPIAQVIFHILDFETSRPYHGKYQDQKSGPQPAIFEKDFPK